VGITRTKPVIAMYKCPHYAVSKIKDADMKQGIVMGYSASFNTLDSDNDIIIPGAFMKTIQEMGPQSSRPRIKYLLDHNTGKSLGVIQTLKEDSQGLYYEAKVGTHDLGQDFLKMVDSGMITEHSIGYGVVRKEIINPDAKYSDQQTRLHELKLWENSALQCWGANMNTPLVGSKSLMKYAEERVPMLIKALHNGTFTDKTFWELEKELILLQQAIKSDYDTTGPDAPDETTQPGDDEKVKAQIAILKASLALS